MSEMSSVGPEKTIPAKEPVSPVRNIVGVIVLLGVLVYGWFEVSAKWTFNAKVKALETRTADEDKGLMTVQEAEGLLGKAADGPAVDFQDGAWNFVQKSYTWRGLLKNHTLTAYYTKEKDSRLHHYETDGTKYELPSSQRPPTTSKKKGESASKGDSGKKSNTATGTAPEVKIVPETKSQPAPSDNKAAAPKVEPPVSPTTKGDPSKPSG